jgi:hypothetical protein
MVGVNNLAGAKKEHELITRRFEAQSSTILVGIASRALNPHARLHVRQPSAAGPSQHRSSPIQQSTPRLRVNTVMNA